MNIRKYLKHLNITDVTGDRLELLKEIQRKHLENVPFENFDIHLLGKLDLNPDALYKKILDDRRGGICYELNFLLYNLLLGLQYGVSILAGKVLDNGSDFDHLFLVVTIDSRKYIVDVGFGDNFFEPLLLTCDIEQNDVKGLFKIVQDTDKRYYLKHENKCGELETAYSFDLVEHEIDEFVERMNWFCQSDESIFKRRLFCSIEKVNGRLSMKPGKLIETINEERHEYAVATFEEFLELLSDKFDLSFLDNKKILKDIFENQYKSS